MDFSEEELIEIFKKSMRLRALGGSSLSAPQCPDEAFSIKKDAWCEVIAHGNKEDFEKRFLWNGINPEQIDEFLYDVSEDEVVSVPVWIKTLDVCVRMACEPFMQNERSSTGRSGDSISPHPFEDIIIPFTYYARQGLKAKAGEGYYWVTGAAHSQLEHNLLEWLCGLNALCMELEFSAFRACHHSGFRRVREPGQRLLSKEYYGKYIQSLQQGDLCTYFKEYPVLARLMATSVDCWIDFSDEVIRHLKKDEADLKAIFNGGRELGRIIDISTSMSDRHNNGRSVMILVFESGLKLVYKPKNIGIERAWVELTGWLTLIGSPIVFKTFKVLEYDDYGWVEFVETMPLENRDQASAYYRNAGGLLCLVYVLGGIDLHYENIIGFGEYPVLIDVETLLHPFAHRSVDEEDAHLKAVQFINRSVVVTGLLPYWQLNGDQAYDGSGLGRSMPQEYTVDVLEWRNVNTDQMRVVKGKDYMNSKKRQFKSANINGFDLDSFTAEIVEGFMEMYRFLILQRELIIRSVHWQALSGQTIRFIFRPTQLYAAIQQNLLYPKFLKSGIDRSIHLDILYRDQVMGESIPACWPLVGVEQAAMENMDIPHFTAKANSVSIEFSGGVKMKDFFVESGFDAATERLRGLNEQDLLQQVELIRATVVCRSAAEDHRVLSKDKVHRPERYDRLTKDLAVRQGVSIAGLLEEKAIKAEDGSITWIAPTFYPAANKYLVEPITDDLYEGHAGVALFFAALFTVTGTQAYRELSLRTLQSFLRRLEKPEILDIPASDLVGGFTGYGSSIYAIGKVGMLTGESWLLGKAKRIASLITKSAVDQDKRYDLMYGTSGTILSLLELYRHFPGEGILDMLSHCGDHLLKERRMSPLGFQSWGSTDRIFLTGFSHGAAGIAYSLLRLYELTGVSAYREAALEAIKYESSVFDEKENNWPDLRRSEPWEGDKGAGGSFSCSWCHGATGIGLARLAALDILNTEAIKKVILLAVEVSRQHALSGIDDICCGNFGRLELLLSAALKFSDDGLMDFALHKAGEIIAIAEESGGFRYNPTIGFTPGFFKGISGIGYQILRMVYPELLPSILTLN